MAAGTGQFYAPRRRRGGDHGRECYSRAIVTGGNSARRGLAGLIVALVVGSAAPPATAQAEDPYDAALIKTSLVGLTPGFWMTAGHESNATREPESFATYETVIVPQLETAWRLGRARLTTAHAVEFLAYPGGEEPSTTNFVNAAQFRIPGARVSPVLRYSYRNHYARPTGFEVGARSQRVEIDMGAGLEVRPGARTTLGAEVRRLTLDWDADAVYEGSILQRNLNRTQDSVSGSMRYRVTPLTSLAAIVDLAEDQFEFAPQRDADTRRVLAGVEFARLAFVSGAAYAGLRRFEPRRAGAEPFTGLVGSGRVVVGRSERTWLTLGYDRDVTYSFDEALAYFVVNDVRAAVTQRLVRTLSLTLDAGYTRLDYSAAGTLGGDDQRHRQSLVGAGLSYGVGRHGRVGVDLSYLRRTGSQSWDDVRVVSFIAYVPGTIQRLDRPLPGER